MRSYNECKALHCYSPSNPYSSGETGTNNYHCDCKTDLELKEMDWSFFRDNSLNRLQNSNQLDSDELIGFNVEFYIDMQNHPSQLAMYFFVVCYGVHE